MLKTFDNLKTFIGIDKSASLPPVAPMRKGVLGLENLPGNVNKKIIISQNDDSLSLFPSSCLEDGLQGDEGDPLRSAMFVFNETESQPETKVSISNELENLPGNASKKIIISHNDDSLSHFLSSYLEDGLQGDEGDPFRSAMFVFNETES